MDLDAIRELMQQVEARHGGWTADNICLAEGLYTLGPPRRHEPGKPYTGAEGVDPRVRRFVQVVADLTGRPLTELRVLDLGPLEGAFAIEFALQGSEVLAIEGRAANLEKIRFVQDVLGLKNLTLVLDDIRNLSLAQHGLFDVVLCSGVLYHLDAPSLYPFLQRVAEVCRRFTLVDTHVSLAAQESYVTHGHTYWGQSVKEHSPGATEEERLAQPWMSLDNVTSFHLTQRSLYNLLRHVGFTSIFECHNPMAYVFHDRNLFVACKGQTQTIRSNPLLNEPEEDWTEKMEWSVPPAGGIEVSASHGELLQKYQQLQSRYNQLEAKHTPFTYFGGTLRQLPRLFWDAIRNRLPNGPGKP